MKIKFNDSKLKSWDMINKISNKEKEKRNKLILYNYRI